MAAMAAGEISWKAQGLTPVGILAELALTPSNLPSIDARVAALQALVEPARQGDDGAISALAGSMQDWHAKIRQTALEALSEVAVRGDRRVVYARLEAVQSLASPARRGKSRALEAIRSALKDEHVAVRLAAAEELAKIAIENDSSDAAELAGKLFALQALATASDEAVALSLDAMCKCLTDWHARIRDIAAKLLQEIVVKGGIAASKALEAFLPLALEGDQRAVSIMSDACSTSLGRQALGSLVQVALVDTATADGLSAKVAAMKTLSKELLAQPCKMSSRDQEAVATVLVMCAQHWHADLRSPALDALCQLAEATHGRGPCGQAALTALMSSRQPAAMRCLQKLSQSTS